ncbi:MAG: hypothetical protein KDF65_05655 [Anaerolineae bacterium]|nr:hypothetical protein [Anaerolineae bacterium]
MTRHLGWLIILIFLLVACRTTEAVTVVEALPLPDTPTSAPPTPTQLFARPHPPTVTPLPPTATAGPPPTPTITPLASLRQITQGACCTGVYWNEESTEVRFIDQPNAADPVGVWGVDVTQPGAVPQLITDRLGIYNEARTHLAYPDPSQGLAIIERLADGQTWAIDTQGSSLSFTPAGGVLWTVSDAELSWQARTNQIWLADLDGSNARTLITLQRGSPAAWLSDEELLVSESVPDSEDVLLSVVSLADGRTREFARLPSFRDGLLSPDRRYLIFMIRFETDEFKNGLWLVDLQSDSQLPKPLPFFGTYRWRDDQHLIYVPFDPAATGHIFYEYDLATGQSRRLSPDNPQAESLLISNNDWRVSPDGRKIALVAARGTDLDGIWVLELAAN